jgi:PAS domain S-box-containing protein
MSKFYFLHKSSTLFSKLIRIKRWQLVLYIFIIANLMTFVLNFTQSYIWWGYINIDLLYIGTIDAAIIVVVLGPIIVLLTSQITRFEEYRNETEARSEAEKKYRLYIENALDIVTVLDENGLIKYESPPIEKMLGYHANEMVGKSVFEFLHPDEREYVYKLFKEKVAEYNSSATLEIRFLKRNGGWVNLTVSGRNLLHDKIVNGLVLNSKDISDLKETQLKLSQLLKEKEILIKEIHHRVKNNFQSVSSMLSLQAQMETNVQLKEMINVSCNRIHSLALIHEKLQESEDVSNVNLLTYFQRLIDNIKLSYQAAQNNISINLNVDADIELATDKSVQLGLIMNELLSNIFKYAFPDNRQGIIIVQLGRSKQMNYLLVKDNGIGLPSDFNISSTKSLGIKIVEMLTKQLQGNLSYQRKDGTEFIIKFPSE